MNVEDRKRTKDVEWDKSKDVYGFELVLDLHECDIERFSRYYLKEYFIMLCDTINMKRCRLVFWDDRWVKILNKLLPWRWIWPGDVQTNPKTTGISAVQFILTSNVTIHMLTLRKAMYVNIFSCKSFDKDIAEDLTASYFGAKKCKARFIERI